MKINLTKHFYKKDNGEVFSIESSFVLPSQALCSQLNINGWFYERHFQYLGHCEVSYEIENPCPNYTEALNDASTKGVDLAIQ